MSLLENYVDFNKLLSSVSANEDGVTKGTKQTFLLFVLTDNKSLAPLLETPTTAPTLSSPPTKLTPTGNASTTSPQTVLTGKNTYTAMTAASAPVRQVLFSA